MLLVRCCLQVLRRHAFLHQGKARMTKVYLGAIENKGGFWPIRDRASKWCAVPCTVLRCDCAVLCCAVDQTAATPLCPCRYMSQEVLPNSAVPYGVQYVAGWGYLLSR